MKRLFLALALSSPAFAAEFYVDAALGDDAAGDGSAAHPWRTIRHALDQVDGDDVVHVAAGTYDQALGEVFPLRIPDTVEVRGAGIGQTILDGDGAYELVLCEGTDGAPPQEPSLTHLTITDAQFGIGVQPSAGFPNVRVEDVESHDVEIAAFVGGSFAFLSLELVRCRIVGGATALSGGGLWGGSSQIAFRDGEITGASTGAYAFGQFGGGGGIAVVRSTIDGCGTGVRADVGGSVALERSLVTRCGAGARAAGAGSLQVRRSTITSNGLGITHSGAGIVFLDGSIVRGNASGDLSASLVFEATYCDTTPLLAGPGNVDVDPLFVNAAAGDYHLAPGSPLIDAGDPTAVQAGLDADQDPLVLDGDLDLAARADIGFDEHNVTRLAVAPAGTVGGLVPFSIDTDVPLTACLGASLGTAELALGALGSLLIDPGSSFALGCSSTTWSGVIPVPGTAALAGTIVHLQAVGYDPSTTAGSLSNRQTVTLQ